MSKLGFVKLAAKAGMKGVSSFLLVLIVGLIVNWLFLWQFILGGGLSGILYYSGLLIFGLALPIACGVAAYQAAIRSSLEHVYENTTHLWQEGVSDWVAEKIAPKPGDNPEMTVPQEHEIDESGFRERLSARAEALPGVFKWGFVKILDQIPIVNILSKVSRDIISGDQSESAATKVFAGIDEFVRDTVLSFGSSMFKLLILINVLLFAVFYWLLS